MKSLLAQLDNPSPKKPFQQYTIEHGIERFEVLVPLHNSKVFEEEFSKLKQRSKSQIIELALAHGGRRL